MIDIFYISIIKINIYYFHLNSNFIINNTQTLLLIIFNLCNMINKKLKNKLINQQINNKMDINN